MLSILALVTFQLARRVNALISDLRTRWLRFVVRRERVMRFWLIFMVWSVGLSWCCFAKLCMMCRLSFLLLMVLWCLVIAFLNPCQLCIRIFASFSKPLVLSLIRPILLTFETQGFIIRFSSLESIFADSNLFCLWFCLFRLITRLMINAQVRRVFRNKNVLKSHNYLGCLDRIMLESSYAFFTLFLDSMLLGPWDFMAPLQQPY